MSSTNQKHAGACVNEYMRLTICVVHVHAIMMFASSIYFFNDTLNWLDTFFFNVIIVCISFSDTFSVITVIPADNNSSLFF